jgi:hypothetical protein
MSESVTIKDNSYNYTAKVDNPEDLGSPVVVTSGKYKVRFDGNDFATKHLRRIRRNSVSELKEGNISGKFQEFMKESKFKAKSRFSGNQHATSTLIFLDLGQYCQFGCQIIKFLSSDSGDWEEFGFGIKQCLQKHVEVTIEKCFASSNSGFGAVKEDVNQVEKLQHGIGITLTVTVRQPLRGNGFDVEVCHYAGGGVDKEFSKNTLSNGWKKLKSIGNSIITL